MMTKGLKENKDSTVCMQITVVAMVLSDQLLQQGFLIYAYLTIK